jgi:hypothetical protein
MARRVLQSKDEIFIRRNYLKLSTKEIGERLGGISKGTVQSFLKRERLRIPDSLKKERRIKAIIARQNSVFHPEDELIHFLHLEMPVNTIAAFVLRSETFVKIRIKKMGLIVPAEIIEQWKLDSRIQPGNISFNKGRKQSEYMTPEAVERTKATRFKKGQKVWNEGKDGDIRIRHDHPERNGKPHKYIRIAKNVWKELQIHNWEKKNGPVPKGFALACKDGNTLNCRSSNWYLISKRENMKRNSLHNYPVEITRTIQLMGALTRQINKNKRRYEEQNTGSAQSSVRTDGKVKQSGSVTGRAKKGNRKGQLHE